MKVVRDMHTDAVNTGINVLLAGCPVEVFTCTAVAAGVLDQQH